MDFRSLLERPGFKQAFHVDERGRVEVANVAERVTPSDVRGLQNACAKLGQQLGLGAVTDIASECAGDAALFVLVGAGGSTTAAVFAPVGDALDDRAREVRSAVYPSDGSVITRHMGFAEVKR